MIQAKIIFSGPVGAGKTSAINAISDTPTVSTEAKASDFVKAIKNSTTVAMDYGVVTLDQSTKIHLYGTPGQERFDFMWDILSQGALGLILIININNKDPINDLKTYLNAFSTLIEETALAIGLTFTDKNNSYTLKDIQQFLSQKNISVPVFEIDGRKEEDIRFLVQSLLLTLDPNIEHAN